jgi:hypothetical protein
MTLITTRGKKTKNSLRKIAIEREMIIVERMKEVEKQAGKFLLIA